MCSGVHVCVCAGVRLGWLPGVFSNTHLPRAPSAGSLGAQSPLHTEEGETQRRATLKHGPHDEGPPIKPPQLKSEGVEEDNCQGKTWLYPVNV